MCNLIWFRGLSNDQLRVVRGNEKDNALAGTFSFTDLVGKLLLQMNVVRKNDAYLLAGFYGNDKDILDLSHFLCEKREVKGLTKKNLNYSPKVPLILIN